MGGSSRNKGEGSSSSKQYKQEYENKIKNNLNALKKKNKCTVKKNKVIYPSQETQEELIQLYLDNNEKFRDAFKMAENPNGERFFDRFASEEYKKEYIQGIIALYKYGEVSMDNLKKYLNIQHRFVQFVLAAHGICIYNNHNNKSKNLDKKDLDKLLEKIENNKKAIKVTTKTMKDLDLFYSTKKSKNFEETDEEEYSVKENNSDDVDEYPHQFQPPSQTNNLFQTPEDSDDDYWEKWNESTM
uniref:Uncharacterized protein n=1 Tax=Meloidogyne javanica TaxID=6303 RepID=A0A915MAX3_MELJA